MSFILISPSEQYLGAAVMSLDGSVKVWVLKKQDEPLYFREWLWNRTEQHGQLIDVRFVGHLACARGFVSRQLAESFQKFLTRAGFSMHIVEVDQKRLIRAVPSQLRKAQAGFALLLELVIAMAILAVLLAGSAVSVVRLKAVQNQQDARTRLRDVAQAVFTTKFCAISANGCNAAPLQATLPAPGSVIQQSGYVFTMTV